MKFPRNLRRAIRALGLAAIVVAPLLATACASGPPEILDVEWTLEERPTADEAASSTRDSLAVFARVHDPEGMDDIEAMWVIDDNAEIFWSLDPSSWTKKTLGDDTWLGASDLTMHDGSVPPPGMYRVVVADLAGDRVSTEFKLDTGGASKTLPKADWRDGSVDVSTSWPENYLLAYDAAGGLIRDAVIGGKGGGLASLVGTIDAARTRAFAVYGYDPASRTGAFSARVRVR